ncbi:MAG: toll/interleukin-1 receptor domain-containing protein [Desulfobulbaceae bacterium]|nr:toll/interleukin-1 receptor domain-containing protein [Desulfobulbaceae bacterium]
MEEALELLSKQPTNDSKNELEYLLTKIQEFVIPWRPSPIPSPGVLYIQPNWAKNTDTQAGEALCLLEALPPILQLSSSEPPSMPKGTSMKIFVSHSSKDKIIAEAFVNLIKTALNIPSKDIRCTSVAGYKLPAGADSNEQLRAEVFGCELFVALLSPTSMKSMYVMFELGARWGTKRHLAPIRVGGLDSSALKAPLSGIHAISGESASDLHQLLSDFGHKLSLEVESAAVYSKALSTFVVSAQTSGK